GYQQRAPGNARLQPGGGVLQRNKLASLLAFANYSFHGGFANVLDPREAVPNGAVAGIGDPGLWFPLRATGITDAGYSLRHEFQAAFVDVRRQNENAHPLAFADEDGNFFRVIDFITEQT